MWQSLVRSIRHPIYVIAIIGMIALFLHGCSKSSSNLSAAEALADGWRQMRIGDQDKARIDFQDALEGSQSPGQAAIHLQAKYGLASLDALGSDSDAAKATDYYNQIVTEDTTGKLAPWAALGIVRLQHLQANVEDQTERENIINAYAHLIEKYPSTPAANEAVVYLDALRLSTLDMSAIQQVQDDSQKAIQNGNTRFLSSLYSLQQTASRLSGDYSTELAAAIRAIQTREDDPSNPGGLDPGPIYTAGVIAQFDVGDFATARKLYAQFLKEGPNDLRGFTVKLLLADMDRVEAGKPSGLIVTSPQKPAGGSP